MLKKFFIFFAIASLLQGFWWQTFGVIDQHIWGDQAHFVQVNDSRQYDPLLAYNPPGGPIIIGTLVINKIFRTSFDSAVLVFMSIFNGLVIALICTLSYVLIKDKYWCLILLFTLSLNRLYLETTPPSACVALLIVALFLLSLYIHENPDKYTWKTLGLWSAVAGLAMSMRPEIAVMAILAFTIILSYVVTDKRRIFFVLGGSAIAFAVFDPFMWKIPIKHIFDIISKVLLFHDKSNLGHIYLPIILNISCLAIISILLSIVFIIYSKRTEPIPSRIIFVLLGLTVFIYAILLTSGKQPARYFVPIIFLWETILPLYLLSLVSIIKPNFIESGKSKINFTKILRIFVACLLIGFQLAIFYVVV